MNAVCDRPGCTVSTRGMCAHRYRRTIRMGINGWRDAEPARQHVAALRQLGWTYEQIAEAAGLSSYVPHKLATGRTRRLWPESEQAILGVPLIPRPSQRGVDATGTRRRVQALAWMGWPAAEVARQAGTSYSALATLTVPGQMVSYALALRVAAVYERLSCTPGPSRVAAGTARRFGHVPPAAWDDDTIDDPRARPCGVPAAGRVVF